jgi:hypothetical protein
MLQRKTRSWQSVHGRGSLRAGFLRLGPARRIPINELSHYTAWQERMMKRPTVAKTVEAEQSISTS